MADSVATVIGDIFRHWPIMSGFVIGEIGYTSGIAFTEYKVNQPPFDVKAGLLGGAVAIVTKYLTMFIGTDYNLGTLLIASGAFFAGLMLQQRSDSKIDAIALGLLLLPGFP